MLDNVLNSLQVYLPILLGALVILIVGWIVAVVLSNLVRGLLSRTQLDNKLAGAAFGTPPASKVPVESWISKAVFWLVMIFVLIAFFNALGLTPLIAPFNLALSQIFAFLPRLVGAAVLALVAWLVATILRMIVTRVLGAARLEDRLGAQTGVGAAARVPIGKTLGEIVYWLVWLFFLPAILDALGLQGLLQPVQTMLDRVLAFLPNLFASAVILLVGWFVARIVQRIVTSLLAAVGIDRVSERVGVSKALGSQGLSGLIGLVVYVLILIPVLIAALNALGLDAITRPASDMLNTILNAIPSIFAALLLLGIAYVVARIIAGLVSGLLAGAGFNSLVSRMGLSQMLPRTGASVELPPGTAARPAEAARAAAARQTPSDIVGMLLIVAIMLFATVEALRLLGFSALAELLAGFLMLAGQIVLGLIIFGLGLYLANLAYRLVRESGTAQADLLATVARIAILVLSGAMALRQMGLANEIVNLAFGLTLGAIAVALALAFGLGGRDTAARLLERWRASIETRPGATGNSSRVTPPTE